MLTTAPLRVSSLACLVSAAALGWVALGGLGGDGLVERSVADAMDHAEVQGASANTPVRSFDPAHIRLSSLPSGHAFGNPVAVGDRITLAQRDGGTATYEVVEVRPLSAQALGAEAHSGPNLMLVTATTGAGRVPAQTIRFIFDGEAKSVPAVPKPHAL